MKLLGMLLIIIVSFIGLIVLVHICSKNNYVIEYSSDRRKIKLYPVQDRASQKTSKKQS